MVLLDNVKASTQLLEIYSLVLMLFNFLMPRRVIRDVQNLETFHKNMYPLSKPGTGTLLYFWVLSFVAVIIYVVIACPDNLYGCLVLPKRCHQLQDTTSVWLWWRLFH